MDAKKFAEFLKERGIKVTKDNKVSVKDAAKVAEFLGDFENEDEGSFKIHLSDWNMQDKVFLFPRDKREELQKKIRSQKKKDGDAISSENWDWFLKHAKRSRGAEDADVFLDYMNAKECMDEWDEYFAD